MARSHQLAEFLRARRERVRPQDVGLQDDDRRRVPGLRREELATLAGLSVDYYMRLEQGRDHRPSEQVLECLARALQLDDDATAHLYGLARAAFAAAQPHPALLESVAPSCGLCWTPGPRSRRSYTDAGLRRPNQPSRAHLTPMSEPGTNILRSVFLNPDARDRCGDLEHACAACVAYMRANVAGHSTTPSSRISSASYRSKARSFASYGRDTTSSKDSPETRSWCTPSQGSSTCTTTRSRSRAPAGRRSW